MTHILRPVVFKLNFFCSGGSNSTGTKARRTSPTFGMLTRFCRTELSGSSLTRTWDVGRGRESSSALPSAAASFASQDVSPWMDTCAKLVSFRWEAHETYKDTVVFTHAPRWSISDPKAVAKFSAASFHSHKVNKRSCITNMLLVRRCGCQLR